MANQHVIEIFSTGCAICNEVAETAKRLAGDAELTVRA